VLSVNGRVRTWLAALRIARIGSVASNACVACVACIACVAVTPALAKPPSAFDPVVEARNYSITLQRQAIYDTPSYQAKLSTVSLENLQNALRIQASDPERLFVDDLC
jgi:hypothetical protein